MPYFGATPVYKSVHDEDVIGEALDNLIVEFTMSRGTLSRSKIEGSKMQRVKLELCVDQIKIRAVGGTIRLDPNRIEFCDVSDLHVSRRERRANKMRSQLLVYIRKN